MALGLKGKGDEREDSAVSVETQKGESQATEVDGWDEEGYGFHLVTPGRYPSPFTHALHTSM